MTIHIEASSFSLGGTVFRVGSKVKEYLGILLESKDGFFYHPSSAAFRSKDLSSKELRQLAEEMDKLWEVKVAFKKFSEGFKFVAKDEVLPKQECPCEVGTWMEVPVSKPKSWWEVVKERF